MPGRPSARLLWLVALALGASTEAARAQSTPMLDGEKRVYARKDVLADSEQQKLAATVAAIESERSPRRFFLVVTRDPAAGVARTLVAEWTRLAQENPDVAWKPETSFVIVAHAGAEDVALEAPAAARDALKLSPFTFRDKLVGPHYAGPAKRGDLALGLLQLVQALSTWLADADEEFAKLRITEQEAGDPLRAAPSEPPNILSERLRSLEGRAAVLEQQGVELGPAEAHLAEARKHLQILLARPQDQRIEVVRDARGAAAELDAAAALVDREQTVRADLLSRLNDMERAIEAAQADPQVNVAELDKARKATADAGRDRMKNPLGAAHRLEEAEHALVAARPLPATTAPAPSALPISWKRLAAAVLALVLVFATGIVMVARAARAEARAAYLARRDEVIRDARSLREVFDKLRDRRDQVARTAAIAIPGTLAVELGLAAEAKAPEGTEATPSDFVLPAPPAPRGETERLLVTVGNGLAEIGAAWDSGERALEGADRLAGSAGMLRAEPFLAARRLLDLVPERADLEPVVAHVSVTADRLALVADEAKAALAASWTAVQRARTALDETARSSVSPLAFEEDVAELHDLVADSVFAASADPVRAVGLANAARDGAVALQAAAERALAMQLEITLVQDAVARVERLLEPGSSTGQDPRGACVRARGSLAEAAAALELGAPDEAQRELEQARTHLALAEEMLARGEEARRHGDTTVEQRRQEAADAKVALEKAKEVLAELEQTHGADATFDTRPVFEAALATLPLLDTEVEELGREATPLASPEAHARLLRLDAHVTELDRAARLVTDRRDQLKAARESLTPRAGELEKRLHELDDHAKQEDVALRQDTLDRIAALRAQVEKTAKEAREGTGAVLAVSRAIESLEAEVEGTRLDVVRDAFLCRRVLSARKAAEESVRHADDAIRRGTDRLAARARSQRARTLIERIDPTLTNPQTDWQVILEGYSCALRASRAARDLGSGKGAEISCFEHARMAAASGIRRAERHDVPLVRLDATEAQGFLRRALAEMPGNEAAAVDLAERAAQAADEARRNAILQLRERARAAEKALRELVRAHRTARESLDRGRRRADARRRAEWIAHRFVKPAPLPEPQAVDTPS
jgi:hypothetical protein